MKTIIAISGDYDGADGKNLDFTDYIIKRTGKEHPKVTILPTAKWDNFELTEDNGFVMRGCPTDVLYLSRYEKDDPAIAETILSSDAIFVGGGNLQRLMNEWKRTGADEILRTAYEKGVVLSGGSSGAMCWFARGYDNCGPDGSFMFVDGTGIIPHFCFSPHFESGRWNTFESAVRQQRYSGLGMENGTAMAYLDGRFCLLKEKPCCNAYFYDSQNGYSKVLLSENAEILNNQFAALEKA